MRMAAAILVLAGMSLAQDEKIYTNSYKGKTPPELEVGKNHWVNAKEAVKLSKLNGRVVWLEFSFLN